LLQNNSSYDLILLGSSIVRGDMDPRIIDSICNISSYNGGVEGGNLQEFKMIFDAYLINHPPPKYLMLALDMSSFNLDRKFFNHLDYYPYLSNSVVDKALCDNGHQTALIKILPFFELTEFDEEMRSQCVQGLLGKTEIMPGQIAYKGFLTRTMTFQSDNINTNVYLMDKPISAGSLDLFKGIEDTCSVRNIKLIINFPPVFQKNEPNHIAYSGKILKNICHLTSESKIHCLDDISLNFCTDSSLFSDCTHLNREGAELYSVILANELLELIREP